MELNFDDKVATITMDDGKVNAVNMSFVEQMNAHLDRVERDAELLILCGREGRFGAGFDLRELSGGSDPTALLNGGFAMLDRLYQLSIPVIAACTGHAIGLGAFLLFVADYRLGVSGSFTFKLPETELGMGFTPILATLAKARIAPNHHIGAILQSQSYNVGQAVEAGFLDEQVNVDAFESRLVQLTANLLKLPKYQYAQTKKMLRADDIAAYRETLS